MQRPSLSLIGIVLILLSLSAHGHEQVDFETQIRPLLVQHCGKCHGPATQKSGLRLDARHAAFKGGDSGPVIVPGNSGDSELLRRMQSVDPDERMPPDGPPLKENEIVLLQRWIDDGAQWPEADYDQEAAIDPRLQHWAFQPLKPVDVPETGDWTANASAPLNEIDQFIIAKLREHSLSLNPVADRRTLVRRLALTDRASASFEDVAHLKRATIPKRGHRWSKRCSQVRVMANVGHRTGWM
ncbi:MAG: c-type cytochrome domain-containing protein [Planctomycetaceae bacterium]